MRRIARLILNIFRRPRVERDLDEELSSYIEMLVASKIRDGLGPEQARREAMIELGGVEQVKEGVREVRLGYLPETIFQDLRYALRSIRKNALLSTAVVATLALGIGISTGAFAFFNATFFRARVDKDFDSFVRVYSAYTTDPAEPGRPGGATIDDYKAYRDQAKSLHDVAAYAQVYMPFGEDYPVETRALLVTPEFFSLYNLEQPLKGRLLLAEDCAAANHVVVLSELLWRTQLSADPNIVGKVVHFNGQPLTVVGVAPTFAGMVNGARAWVPYTLDEYLKQGDELDHRADAAWLRVEARLNPGFSRRDAAEDLKAIASRMDRLHPGRKTTLWVTDGSDIQEPGGPPLLKWAVEIVICSVSLLVVLVCANVTTLLLSRAAARRHEIAVRLAMGAGRARLIRLLMTETLLQAIAAGAASVYIAYQLPGLLKSWLSNSDVRASLDWSMAPDMRTFIYLTTVTLMAAILAGLAPALQSTKIDLSEVLKGVYGWPGRSSGRSRMHSMLVGVQVALSCFLLWWIVTGVQAYRRTANFNPGYEARHLIVARPWWSRQLESHAWAGFHQKLSAGLASLPGVQSIAFSNVEPFNHDDAINIGPKGRQVRRAELALVSPNFFATLGIPILSGRPLEDQDGPWTNSGCSAVISGSLARLMWPGENPVGKTLESAHGQTFEIVGVAADASIQRVGGPDEPTLYAAWNPNWYPYNAYIRFAGDGAEIERRVASIVHDIAPEISIKAETVRQKIDWHLENFGRIVSVVSALGVAALILAIVGIYGVVAFTVTQRTREMGIRLSLGAQKRDIYRTMIGSNAAPVCAGLLVGLSLTLIVALALDRILLGQPFSLGLHNPSTYIATALTLGAAAMAAMLAPARRATRVDPVSALRHE